MEKTMKDYAAFERAMNEEKLYLTMDFEGICRKIGADSDALDEKVYSELGFDGPDIVEYYRSLLLNLENK